MATRCGTGFKSALRGPEMFARKGMRSVLVKHKRRKPANLGQWFGPRHGKPWGRYVLRRIEGKPVRWYVDVASEGECRQYARLLIGLLSRGKPLAPAVPLIDFILWT